MLKIENLAVQIGSQQPVEKVSFSIESGRTRGVVGESGSGKSMTSLAIMGLLPLGARASGSVMWQGRELLTMSERQHREIRGREIAMIFQDPMSSLNPSFSVGFQIDEVLRLKLGIRDARVRRERGIKLLSEVGITLPDERWNAYPHQLSGGMSQRVCIAMALACEPKLLIADEPTTALDVTVQMQILKLLAGIKRDHAMSMLFVTHDLAVAAQICDEMTVLYRGRSIESGPAAKILTAPDDRYTQALLRARPSANTMPRSVLPTVDSVE